MVVKQVGIVFAVHGDFVGKPPYHDGRMVVVLRDEFLHLGDGVFSTARKVFGDIRDFRPNNHTYFVAKIVEVLIVLVVRQSDSSCSHFANQINIFFVMFRQKSITDAPSILMARYTTKRIFFTIKNKSIFGINFKCTATKTGRYIINNIAVF